MTRLAPPTGEIPLPVPSVTSAPYWAGCARGELLFQRCVDCGAATHTPASICSACWSTALSWERSSGAGVVYSHTTVWRPPTPGFPSPFVAVIVDMAEGWQLLTNLIGCEHDAVHVGMPVVVTFETVAGGATLPYVRPAEGDGDG